MNPPAAARPRLPRALKLAVHLGLTGLITWFILEAVDFNLEELRRFDLSELEVRWWLMGTSSLILLLAYLFSAGLWGLMVREIGTEEVGLKASLRVFFTANLGRYLPGKLWQIAGLAYLARGEGVPAGTATGAAILGQAFSLAGATLLGAGILLQLGPTPASGGGWVGLVLLVVLLVGTSPSLLKRLLPLWFRMARQEIPRGFRPDHAFGLRWMGLYAMGWVLQGLAFWVLARSLGLEITLLEGIPAYSAAYVAGYLVLFAPAGVGVREGVLVASLAPGLGAGAGVLAILARLWSTLVELVPAMALGSSYLRRSMKGDAQGD